jgi:hypothetical protein
VIPTRPDAKLSTRAEVTDGDRPRLNNPEIIARFTRPEPANAAERS